MREVHILKKKFTTNLDSILLEKLKIQAIKECKDVNEILEYLIEQYLKEGNIL